MKRLMIANRGEVVIRVLRTAKEMGLETIVVYSEADKDMEYLEYADEAVKIGPAQPSKSYLNMDAIISAAIAWKANAIHPGYGFLSENPSLAALCEENGIAFVGPTSATLRTIGNKSRTKEVAQSLGIPTIPGSYGVVSDISQTIDLANRLGLPVILKSLYGGGGRGMKVAYTEDQLRSQFANVSSEANAAFGRNEVYIEHYISCPRHLEVQVLADEYGNIQVLGDRECSIQRRHQKIIEEAPIPNIDNAVRECLWKWSRMIIQAIGFKGLGTVEFLMDQKGSTYFLEINGRLQVEHPVTEMVTGIDMVREQIMISAGSRLDNSPISITGHAIECRLNAENTAKNFMPTTGTINILRLPGGPGTRVDTHLFPGCDISSFYDPLLVKLIAHNKTRNGALRRMSRMLDETTIDGITTNKDLLRKLLNNDQFLAGNGDTSLVTQLIDK
ncbi:MAG TPA: biotin carboxylase N-terminal domain-containing protein [Deltaproteobacteria bacterium]|nr:biotin carboxylase N-terminal domain-containing protein [Deltaproteobacteria bacterium]HPJ93924.1 biotin carboxylase N-terminal domain-containing protein [Deltaproteobacteria bacterium]HPR51633.1 biotin carboxylase N-terminal domain-containing protein [Deltaproteobacteria bacterium]